LIGWCGCWRWSWFPCPCCSGIQVDPSRVETRRFQGQGKLHSTCTAPPRHLVILRSRLLRESLEFRRVEQQLPAARVGTHSLPGVTRFGYVDHTGCDVDHTDCHHLVFGPMGCHSHARGVSEIGHADHTGCHMDHTGCQHLVFYSKMTWYNTKSANPTCSAAWDRGPSETRRRFSRGSPGGPRWWTPSRPFVSSAWGWTPHGARRGRRGGAPASGAPTAAIAWRREMRSF
jgi:hypothetical protein